MAYKHFNMSKGNQYQHAIGVLEIVRMLTSLEDGMAGATAIAFEAAGLGGWDDLVVFSTESLGGPTQATHWQIKNISTDQIGTRSFKALGKYFEDLKGILDERPYDLATSIQAQHVRFHFQVTSPNLKLGPSSTDCANFAQLQKLCNYAGTPEEHSPYTPAALAQLSNDQQRWFKWISAWYGEDACVTWDTLKHLSIEQGPTPDGAKAEALRLLGAVTTDPKGCWSSISESLIETPPNGQIIPCVLTNSLRHLASTRKAQHQVVRLHQGRICITGPWAEQSEVAKDAASLLVQAIWDSPRPEISVQITLQEAASFEGLQEAILRLVVHAPLSAVTMSAAQMWMHRSNRWMGGCVGESDRAEPPECSRVKEVIPRPAISPRNAYCPTEFAEALQQSMNDWFWKKTECAALARCTPKPGFNLHPSVKNTVKFAQAFPARDFQFRTLRPWWPKNEMGASLRAGPRSAVRMSWIVVGLACLCKMNLAKLTQESRFAIGLVANLPVRALALLGYADNTAEGLDALVLADGWMHLLEPRALVLLPDCSNPQEIYSSWEDARKVPNFGVNMQSSSPAALLLSSGQLFRELSKDVQSAGRYIDRVKAYVVEESVHDLNSAIAAAKELDSVA